MLNFILVLDCREIYLCTNEYKNNYMQEMKVKVASKIRTILMPILSFMHLVYSFSIFILIGITFPFNSITFFFFSAVSLTTFSLVFNIFITFFPFKFGFHFLLFNYFLEANFILFFFFFLDFHLIVNKIFKFICNLLF